MHNLVQRVSSALIGSHSAVEGIAKAGTLLRKHTHAEAVQINALTPDEERVVEIFSQGNLTDLFPSGLRRPAHGSSMSIISSKGPFLFAHEELQEASLRGVEDFSVALSARHSFLAAAPIKLHDSTLGSVQLFSPRPFSADVMDALEQVTPLISPYISLFLAGVESAAEDQISSSIERVAEAVIRESSLDGVCDAVVGFARSSMGIDAALLRIDDHANQVLKIEYKYGHLDAEEVAGPHFKVVEDQLIPMAVERLGPMIIDEGSPEIFNDSEALELLEQIPSLLIMPLMDKGQLLGTMEFYSLNEYAYRAEHLRNVEHVANLLTSAVEHFQLIRSLSREAEIRRALAEVARLASAAGDLSSLVGSISPELSKVVPVDRISYYMPPERFQSPNDESKETENNSSESVVFANGSARIVTIGTTTPTLEKCGSEGVTESPCGATFCVGAKLWESAVDRPQGWIHLERSQSPFNSEEVELASEFARHISPAIDTALSHEAELRLAQEQLRAERAEAEVENQQKLNEAKGNFIATMSHELRTPLTSIRAFADLLNRDAESMSERQRKQISIVQRNSEWLNILINDLLDLSSIDSGRFELQYEEVEFGSLISGLMESFGPIAEVAGHELTAILPTKPIEVQIDPSRVSQIVGNLLTNATKYSPSGTPIRLLARPTSDGVSVYIRDEGPGIPVSQQKQIFDRFTRAESEASKSARGTGIGLYVSKMIVEGHGGRIGVTSVPDSHTTMHFWLPNKPQTEAASVGDEAA